MNYCNERPFFYKGSVFFFYIKFYFFRMAAILFPNLEYSFTVFLSQMGIAIEFCSKFFVLFILLTCFFGRAWPQNAAQCHLIASGRFFVPKPSFFNKLISCPYCLSFWISLVSAFVATGNPLLGFVVYPISLIIYFSFIKIFLKNA